MFLTCLEKPSIFTPFPVEVYGGSLNCCYTLDCELRLDPAQPPRTITNLTTDYTVGCPFNILEVNGQPYTNPIPAGILVTASSPVLVKIEVCPCSGVGTTWNADFIIDYTDSFGAGTETITYGFTEINPALPAYEPVSSTLTDWNLFPCVTGTGNCGDLMAANNNLNTQSLPITNHSDFDIPIVIADLGNFPLGASYYIDGVLNPNGNTVIIPPQTTIILGVGFCWATLTPATFDIDVVLCDVFTLKVDVNVIPVTCLGCGIGCRDIIIETESAYLPTLNAGCNYGLPNVYTESAIGEKKTIIWKYTYNNGFVNGNFDLYFNPILWTYVQSILPVDPYSLPLPAEGWYIKIQDYMVTNPPYNMYQVTSAINAPSQQNWEVQVEVPNYNEFYIYFTFYMTMDIDDEVSNTILDNAKRFVESQINENFGNQTLGPLASVYRTLRFLGKELFFIDNNVNDPNFIGERPFRCFLYRSLPMSSRWYNKSLYGNPSEFQNPTFTYYRNGQFWAASFATYSETEVTFEVDLPGGATPSAMVAYLFENTNSSVTTNNSVDFLTNYDISRGQILTNAVPATIDNYIKSPSQGPTNIGGNRWQIKFMVGPGLNGIGYGLAVIVYDNANDMVNTFTAGVSIPVDPNLNSSAVCCDLDVNYELSDFYNTYSGANWYDIYIPYKQRFSFKVELDGGLFESQCLANFGYSGDWKDVLTDIRLLVSKRDTTLNATNIVYFIYDQYQSFRQTGFPNNWNNLFSSFTVKDLLNGKVELEWDARGRWESGVSFPASQVYIAPFTQPYNLSLAGGPAQNYINTAGINYNWSATANNCIIASVLIRFDLTTVANLPNNQPLYVNKYMEFPICFFPEEDDATYPWGGGLPITMNTLTVEGCDINGCTPIVGPICPGDYDYVKITMTSINPADTGYVIGFFNKSPYGILSLQEEDYYPFPIGPNGLLTMDSPYIYDLSQGVQAGSWEFKFDINSLPPGTYELCAMYIPNVP